MPGAPDKSFEELIADLIETQQLPVDYWSMLQPFLLPFAEKLAAAQSAKQNPYVLGINGGQGSGKTTLCLFLKCVLECMYKKKCVVLSMDDFYLGKAQRAQLAREHHPLLQTRGVPGTHNVDLGVATLDALLAKRQVDLPGFSKANDDILPHTLWSVQNEVVDFILFEGWCVAAKAQTHAQLVPAINQLEREEDADGKWRHSVNEALLKEYPRLFKYIDQLLMLKAPDMQTIFAWRSLQEKKMAAAGMSSVKPAVVPMPAVASMNAIQLRRFIQHYERLTLHMLNELPARADTVFELDEQHRIKSSRGI